MKSESEMVCFFTLGNQGVEHNDYTGWEEEPNVRLAWNVHRQAAVMGGSVAPPVRTPSRIDRDLAETRPSQLGHP